MKESDVKNNFEENWIQLQKEEKRFDLFKKFYSEPEIHPEMYADYECAFTAYYLREYQCKNILDVGSYRWFLYGLMSCHNLTSVDVRQRRQMVPYEKIVTTDAKNLPFPNRSFDTIISLSSVEHFGLSRYCDEFDVSADTQFFNEAKRVLKKDGILIFSTHITARKPFIIFNAHRVYSLEMIQDLCFGLNIISQKFYSRSTNSLCLYSEITNKENEWDNYCGCWRKI